MLIMEFRAKNDRDASLLAEAIIAEGALVQAGARVAELKIDVEPAPAEYVGDSPFTTFRIRPSGLLPSGEVVVSLGGSAAARFAHTGDLILLGDGNLDALYTVEALP